VKIRLHLHAWERPNRGRDYALRLVSV
jgi:hypothetical protein